MIRMIGVINSLVFDESFFALKLPPDKVGINSGGFNTLLWF
jgi:hypothetical protein